MLYFSFEQAPHNFLFHMGLFVWINLYNLYENKQHWVIFKLKKYIDENCVYKIQLNWFKSILMFCEHVLKKI